MEFPEGAPTIDYGRLQGPHTSAYVVHSPELNPSLAPIAPRRHRGEFPATVLYLFIACWNNLNARHEFCTYIPPLRRLFVSTLIPSLNYGISIVVRLKRRRTTVSFMSFTTQFLRCSITIHLSGLTRYQCYRTLNEIN